ncbi:hypothetical protein Glove_123g54 [Diversispora epigaea]|uniref:Uncharacterized protein n=1 Tax=Diversispora epigaea TaxID=1348612 RepID=A0A397IYL7_9GLOM|nr:hypothetical protein Glove_123g54 [Diversispora epigaea]
MFKRKSNLPATPSPLSFNDILSDLTRLQTYNQQQIGENVNILEIINTDTTTTTTTTTNATNDTTNDNNEASKKNEDTKGKGKSKSIEFSSDSSSLIDHLHQLTASSSSITTAITSIPQETLDDTYNLCTNFIRVNDQLLVSRKDFNGLGLEIKGLKKELNSMIETLEKHEVNNYDLEEEEEDVIHEEDI